MPRNTRLFFKDAWYHVMNRGSGRQAIFSVDGDYYNFLDLLNIVSGRFNAEIHSYCLMQNHYHLLIRTPDANLDEIMQYISSVYTKLYNKRVGSDN